MKLAASVASVIVLFVVEAGLSAATPFDLGQAKLTIGTASETRLEFADGARWPSSSQPTFALEAEGVSYPAKSVECSGNKMRVVFQNGDEAEFRVTQGNGFALFESTKLTTQKTPAKLQLFQLPAPAKARVSGTLNGAMFEGNFAAVMAAKPNVHALYQQAGGTQVDRAGCSHEMTPVTPGRVGMRAARFSAKSDSMAGGWSMSGRNFAKPLNLGGCRALQAWVHGDGKGEALKIQLYDGAGGYRDNYLTIDFQGWRHVLLTNSAIDTLRYDHTATLNLYYNSLPTNTAVTCLVDQIEALVERDGESRTIVLEDFEDAASPLWSSPTINLCAQTEQAHGITPAAFGVIACRESNLGETIQRFEKAAGLPSPRPGGVWNKQSPLVKRSYLFLTRFQESQFEEGVALARRGGFDTVLLGQESWSLGTGHYEINREHFPDGLEGLKRTVQRFKDAGFRVGLHFLGASIYPPDSYLTPVPDPRLVKGAAATLAGDISATNTVIPTATGPGDFPAEDGGYTGEGTVVQIGDELIQYGTRKLQAPYGFAGCRRGHLGTKAVAHRAGETVRHLVRAYGYHMYDMDTTLLDEVAGHFARVANTCGIEMIYFDGSERLQGEHWFYNARLHKAFYDKLANKDTLLQASSFSHYSWHLLARSASADGHGDLKGYLDQRSGAFLSFARDSMPLDVGWYYGYDPTTTPDMFEYVLGATIGYNSSMSFQVSCEAASKHPFTGEILDLIARYEKLRLSGTLPEAVRERFRIDSAMQAIKPGDSQPELLERRREYRLLEEDGKAFFQRVIYGSWQEVQPGGADKTNRTSWTFQVKNDGARVGMQLQVLKGAELTDPVIEAGGRRWAWKGKLAEGEFLFFWPGEPVSHYGPGLRTPERGALAPGHRLASGEYTARLSCQSSRGVIRTRTTQQPAERLEF